jgi:hypothetical protein
MEKAPSFAAVSTDAARSRMSSSFASTTRISHRGQIEEIICTSIDVSCAQSASIAGKTRALPVCPTLRKQRFSVVQDRSP